MGFLDSLSSSLDSWCDSLDRDYQMGNVVDSVNSGFGMGRRNDLLYRGINSGIRGPLDGFADVANENVERNDEYWRY